MAPEADEVQSGDRSNPLKPVCRRRRDLSFLYSFVFLAPQIKILAFFGISAFWPLLNFFDFQVLQDTGHITQDTGHRKHYTGHRTHDTRHMRQDTQHKTQDT